MSQTRKLKVSDVVREHGGYLVRTLNCLNEFHTKHGAWPQALRLSRGANDLLLTQHLTPLGYALLIEKLHLKVAQVDDAPLIAENCDGRTLHYGKEGWSGKSQSRADVWLWGVAISPD